MSATRDKSQKFSFVYSNLYHVYRKGLDAANGSGAVLKTGDLRKERKEGVAAIRIGAYSPAELLAKRIERGHAAPVGAPAPVAPAAQALDRIRRIGKPVTEAAPASAVEHNAAIKSLKDNLQSLGELHARLRFMLTELEDLVKE